MRLHDSKINQLIQILINHMMCLSMIFINQLQKIYTQQSIMGKKDKSKNISVQQSKISQLFNKHQESKKIKKEQKSENIKQSKQEKTKKNQKQHQQKDIKSKNQIPQQKLIKNQNIPQEQQDDEADIDLNHIQEQQEQVDVSFLIAEISDDYYHSLKTILRRYGQIVKINQSQIAACVVDNKNCGNVTLADDSQQAQDIKSSQNQDEDDDQLNAYSILNIFKDNLPVCKNIKDLFMKSIQKKGKQFSQIKQILQKQSCSLLLNERLSNLPAFVVQNSHEVFKKQLQEIKKSDPKKFKQLCGQWLLNISQIEREGSDELDRIIFSKFEDYEMCKRAKKWWLGENLPTNRKKADLRRLYYVIKTEQYLKGVQKIKQYLE